MNAYETRRKGDYLLRAQASGALEVCVILAKAPGHRLNSAQIMEASGFSVSYLELLFRLLKEKKITATIRGPGGGYILTRPPTEITLADIIKATLNDDDRGGFYPFIYRRMLDVCKNITIKQLASK